MGRPIPYTDVNNQADPVYLIDPATGLPYTSGNPLPVSGDSGGNPAAVYADQQVVTASAVALAGHTLANGVVIKAKSTNVGNVFVGSSGVTAADDGTGTGYRLLPGEAISFGVTNASAIFIIGTLNDVIYIAGN